jgi:phosphatidylglycerophosphate synthase
METRNGARAIVMDRRPISLRDLAWVRAIAAGLIQLGVKPNQISLLGVGFAALSAACLLLAPAAGTAWRSVLFIGATAFIAFRGLCNLCDGLMAIEGGQRTPSGEIFNDLPDRASDVLFLVAAGYSLPGVTWTHELGWLAALLAVLTAHIRVLGAASGAAQQFVGPMAKPHRMAVMGLACIAAAVESAMGAWPSAIVGGLAVVAAGSGITVARRTARVLQALDA